MSIRKLKIDFLTNLGGVLSSSDQRSSSTVVANTNEGTPRDCKERYIKTDRLWKSKMERCKGRMRRYGFGRERRKERWRRSKLFGEKGNFVLSGPKNTTWMTHEGAFVT